MGNLNIVSSLLPADHSYVTKTKVPTDKSLVPCRVTVRHFPVSDFSHSCFRNGLLLRNHPGHYFTFRRSGGLIFQLVLATLIAALLVRSLATSGLTAVLNKPDTTAALTALGYLAFISLVLYWAASVLDSILFPRQNLFCKLKKDEEGHHFFHVFQREEKEWPSRIKLVSSTIECISEGDFLRLKEEFYSEKNTFYPPFTKILNKVGLAILGPIAAVAMLVGIIFAGILVFGLVSVGLQGLFTASVSTLLAIIVLILLFK